MGVPVVYPKEPFDERKLIETGEYFWEYVIGQHQRTCSPLQNHSSYDLNRAGHKYGHFAFGKPL